MIILNDKKIKRNIKEILNNYQISLNFGFLECPYCKSSNLIRWGKYIRNCYYIDDNNVIFDILKIQRVKCKDCNHTHALLPSFIIPYKQFLLDVILTCINNNSITYKYKFSFDTISKWKYQFNKFLPYLKTIYFNHNNLINYIIDNIFNVYENFYNTCKKILMMTHKGIFNMAYF
ncbi:MAG: DUF6431 domain-containing protein [Roseburia sp.]|nr:DUF6431 domain-containing protein [Roseburia sp.]